jgi:hypothetical protein
MRVSLLPAAIFLVIGVLLGSFFTPYLSREDRDSGAQSQGQWRMKLQALTDQDIAEYYRLKTLEERYKKADEILGKIMVIFLADLGLKVAPETIEQTKLKLIDVPYVGTSEGMRSANPVEGAANPTTATGADSSNAWKWIAAEKSRELIRSDREAPGFLEKVKIENLDEALKSSALFGNRTQILEMLQGRFSGMAHVTYDQKSRDWAVELFLDAKVVEGRLQGVARAKMSENGKEFSNSSDGGDMTSYREFTTGSDAVLIKVSPSVAFQVYYLKAMNSLVGNVYRRTTEDEAYQYIGTLNLKR